MDAGVLKVKEAMEVQLVGWTAMSAQGWGPEGLAGLGGSHSGRVRHKEDNHLSTEGGQLFGARPAGMEPSGSGSAGGGHPRDSLGCLTEEQARPGSTQSLWCACTRKVKAPVPRELADAGLGCMWAGHGRFLQDSG